MRIVISTGHWFVSHEIIRNLPSCLVYVHMCCIVCIFSWGWSGTGCICL